VNMAFEGAVEDFEERWSKVEALAQWFVGSDSECDWDEALFRADACLSEAAEQTAGDVSVIVRPEWRSTIALLKSRKTIR
jgi:hypothetical protein